MNILNKVALQSLKKNKARTAVTIIGIMLSAAMICAVTTCVASVQNYSLQNMIYKNGDWHGSALNVGWETCESLMNSKDVESAVYSEQLGYAIAEGCINDYKPYIYVIGVSDAFYETMPVHVTEGVPATAQNEILLPEHLASNGNVFYEIGDEITLALGNRILDGHTMHQNNPCYVYEDGKQIKTDEVLEITEERTYTVVGFYERPNFEPYTAPGYTAITVEDKNPISEMNFDIYFKMEDPQYVYDFINDNGIFGVTNDEVLLFNGVAHFDTFYTMLYGVAAIIIGLIMVGSVSLIYNAFAISVSDRTKQFGLLASVGATKKQLRRMVLFEAIVVSLIGIPLGIIAGIGGIGVTLLLIGHKISSVGRFAQPMRICVSPAAIVIAIVVALVTVLISAWVPSMRATKISAVEAIRQNRDIRADKSSTNTRKINTNYQSVSWVGGQKKISKMVIKLFGFPGILAGKYYKRYRKKYRATIASLFMSVVLFVSASAFSEFFMDAVTSGFDTDGFDIMYYVYDDQLKAMSPEGLLKTLSEEETVNEGAFCVNLHWGGYISKKDLNTNYIELYETNISAQEKTADSMYVNLKFVFVDDASFGKLLDVYHLDENDYMNSDAPLCIAVDGYLLYDQSKGKYRDMNILQTDAFTANVDIPWVDGDKNIDIQAGKVIDEYPYYARENNDVLTMIYPWSLKNSVFPDEDFTKYTYEYYFISENHKTSYSAMKEMLERKGFDSTMLVNYAQEVEDARNIVMFIKVFAYGFTTLISLIAAANVFNTMSTNIHLRRREFAMLKSVGMSSKEMNRMLQYECIIYGSKSLLYGLPMSIFVTILIYMAIHSGYESGFYLPWEAMGIAVISVFIVVFGTMMYAVQKIKEDNPIDALRNENI